MRLVEILAIVSPIAAMVFGLLAFRRGQKNDDGQAAREIGTMLTEIGYIKSQLDTVQRKLESNDTRHSSVLERLSAVEQSDKSAHKRLDSLENIVKNFN
jgi:septal ring factor EnvC (AmiA/AmiB activator)